METLACSATTSQSLPVVVSKLSVVNRRPNSSLPVFPWRSMTSKIVKAQHWSTLQCLRSSVYCRPSYHDTNKNFEVLWKFHKRLLFRCGPICLSYGHHLKSDRSIVCLHKIIRWHEKFKHYASVIFVRLVIGMLVITVSISVSKTPSYVAIRKMLATLDDPFTRFLEPDKFKSLRSGTQGSLTGVGLSIGYPTKFEGSTGLVVISSSPGGPANRAGIMSGDIILAIDETSTETMGLYGAAERLQGPEGSSVELTIRSGPDIKHLALTLEKLSLNPVKSRLCDVPGLGKDTSRIGYIKLTSFNQNASAAVKEAIETLRSNNVNAFVLDLRDNSGGLFPEGIEIAKIWLEKGVIVYICDNRGVRDIYEADGSNAIAVSEPLAVLVNKGTASASEILAGALKDNKRAVLFGEPTFGKGKIQSVFELSDGSGLAVTVARYETPAHNDIDKVGVIPDRPLPGSFPTDEDGFCTCLKDPASTCSLNKVELFSR
ncbi:carboxyl-terminal-processing peptidase 2, chloroplastic isoform X3 [Macadamia integrifolia]|uniref:carboxyl-terminal-processing peptidase 2, chloroplastic isoform X3 n=1 Tax=Macadamia integrifolia TaxID=60698 RepID=UPI001C4F0E87|nr:carboxyl-terminal-processing peptidase 2, chloroplastic isoform X3 [Macadamia integrifolia]